MTQGDDIFETMAEITRETYSKNDKMDPLSSCELTKDGKAQEAGGPTPLDNDLMTKPTTKEIVDKIRASTKPFAGQIDTHIMMPIEVAKEIAESHNTLMNLRSILKKIL